MPSPNNKTNRKAILAKLNGEMAEAKVDKQVDDEIRYLGYYDSKGDKKIVCNTENIRRMLEGDERFAGTIRYDDFSECLQVRKQDQWCDYEDGDDVTYQNTIASSESAFFKVSKNMVFDAMTVVAYNHRIDTAKEYFENLKWDKKPRLNLWLSTVYGCAPDEYHQRVGSQWLMGAVARTHSGLKHQVVLVLEGDQGTKKSTSLSSFFGSWHIETLIDVSNKDFYQLLQGSMVVEFSEGETLSRSDVKHLKGVITTENDRYRAPYARTTKNHKRRCSFAMTTNQDQYLKDETGNRRWLPVKVEKIADIAWLEANRDQLLAEAYYRALVEKEEYWDYDGAIFTEAQESRRVSSPNEELVMDWWETVDQETRNEGITILQVWVGAYNSGARMGATMKKYEEMEIADTLKRVLKLDRERRMLDNSRKWRWFESEESKIVSKAVLTKKVIDGEVDDF